MTDVVYILAQGEQRRWSRNGKGLQEKLPPFKHLLPVGKYGTPIISRTFIMLRCHMYSDYLWAIARTEAVSAVIPNIPLNEPTGPILQSVAMLLAGEFDRWIFLLGDVVYSHQLLDAILDCKQEVKFFGRVGGNRFTGKEASELFGLVVDSTAVENVRKHCLWLLRRGGTVHNPKLWHLYRQIAGLDVKDWESFEPEILHRVDDYTDDIDGPEEYKKFWNKLNTYAAKDDDQCRCDLVRQELFSSK